MWGALSTSPDARAALGCGAPEGRSAAAKEPGSAHGSGPRSQAPHTSVRATVGRSLSVQSLLVVLCKVKLGLVSSS